MSSKRTLASTIRYKYFDIDTHALVAYADAITDASIEAAIEEAEVRGGWGNAVISTYNHSSAVNISATSAVFQLEYIAMKLGSDISYGKDVMKTEEVEVTSNKGIIVGDPISFDGAFVAWAKIKGVDSDFTTVTFDKDTKEFSFPAEDGTKLCVSYFFYDRNARTTRVKTNFAPSTYHVIGEIQEFDENGNPWGITQIDIPKLKLNAGFTIELTADGVASIDLSGKALKKDTTDNCEGSNDSYYCDITEIPFTEKWFDNAIAISANPSILDEMVVGDKEVVKAMASYTNAVSNYIATDELVYSIPEGDVGIATVNATTGEVTAVGEGSTVLTIKVKEKPDLKDTVNITVSL